MAAQLAASPNQPGRLSQLLPSVKCSSCAALVPLSELGEHVCAAAPPVPKIPSSAASILGGGFASRLQTLVASTTGGNQRSPASPSSPPPPPSPSSSRPSQQPSPPRLNTQGGQQPSIAERLRMGSPTSPQRPPIQRTHTGSPLARPELVRTGSAPPPPTGPGQSSSGYSPPRMNSPAVGSPLSPGGGGGGRINSPAPSARIGSSVQSVRINSPAPSARINSPAPSARMGPPGPSQQPPPSPMGRPRAPSTASSRSVNMHPQQPIPIQRSLPPPQQQIPPPQSNQRNTQQQPPPPSQIPPSSDNASMYNGPSNHSYHHPSSPPRQPSQQQGGLNYPPPPPTPQANNNNNNNKIPSISEPNTQSGGEAGMAGVGRRGFAAAARAAMFTMGPAPQQLQSRGHVPVIPPIRSHHDQQQMQQPYDSFNNRGPMHPHSDSQQQQQLPPPSGGMNGRRLASPGRLDITSATSSSIRSANTPPLSPNSGYSSHSPGPKSLSPQALTPSSSPSHLPPHSPSSRSPSPRIMPIPPVHSDHPDAIGSPGSPFFDNIKGKAPESSAILNERKPSLASSHTSEGSSAAGFNLFGNDKDDDETPGRMVDSPPLSPVSSGSEYGLAYADETDDEDGPPLPLVGATTPKSNLPTSILRSPTNGTSSSSSSSSSSPPRKVRTVEPVRGLNLRKKSDTASSVTSVSSYSTVRNGLDRNASTSSSGTHMHMRNGSIGDDILGDGHANANARLSKMSAGSAYSRDTTVERTMDNSVWEDRNGESSEMMKGGLAALMAKTVEFEIKEKEENRESVGTALGVAKRSNTVAHSPEMSSSRSAIKLPTRSRTERDSSSSQLHRQRVAAAGAGDIGVVGKGVLVGEVPQKKKKARVCVRCEKRITDGRWVKVDTEGGGVLCERCWKNMYLPKCRRCNLPIENQAVSSSDGQLKGKYHRDCFNCHKCHKPFPDKTFYVFEGKPLCAYHYHEANDSLCAATLCGKPIEGPCAISHAGDKYHPEHMLCEHPLSECKVQLLEYWEVDGRMLCEKHSVWKGGSSGSEDEDEEGGGSRRARAAQKRVTRFIDLGADGGLDLVSGYATSNSAATTPTTERKPSVGSRF